MKDQLLHQSVPNQSVDSQDSQEQLETTEKTISSFNPIDNVTTILKSTQARRQGPEVEGHKMAITEQQRLEFFAQKVSELPAFPAVVSELARLIDHPLSTTEKIEQLLMMDTGLTIKTLRVANSAYYAIPGGAKTIRRAVTVLGMATLKQIVITSAVFGQFEGKSQGFDSNKFWRHSIFTASIGELLARNFDLGKPEDAFVCGLVHDIGKILLNMYDPAEYTKINELAAKESIPYEEAEKKLGSVRHGRIGGVIARMWNLSFVIQAAVQDHHIIGVPSRYNQDKEVNKSVDAIFLANRIIHNFEVAAGQPKPFNFENDEVLKRNGIKLEDIQKLEPDFQKATTSASSLLNSLMSKA